MIILPLISSEGFKVHCEMSCVQMSLTAVSYFSDKCLYWVLASKAAAKSTDLGEAQSSAK